MPMQECAYTNKEELQANNETKYLQPPSYNSHRSYQGTMQCPWSIHTDPGQQINITLFNFIVNQYSPEECPMHAIIKDGNSSKEKAVCQNSRESEFYVSSSNHVEIYLVLHSGGTTPQFLLTYRGKL